MTKLVFEVGGALWNDYPGGVHEVDGPDAELVAHVHAAQAADIGVSILEWDGKDPGNVESQEKSEKAYAAAQADGRWQEGHLEDVVAQGEAVLAAGGLDEETLAKVELRVERAKAELASRNAESEKKGGR